MKAFIVVFFSLQSIINLSAVQVLLCDAKQYTFTHFILQQPFGEVTNKGIKISKFIHSSIQLLVYIQTWWNMLNVICILLTFHTNYHCKSNIPIKMSSSFWTFIGDIKILIYLTLILSICTRAVSKVPGIYPPFC